MSTVDSQRQPSLDLSIYMKLGYHADPNYKDYLADRPSRVECKDGVLRIIVDGAENQGRLEEKDQVRNNAKAIVDKLIGALQEIFIRSGGYDARKEELGIQRILAEREQWTPVTAKDVIEITDFSIDLNADDPLETIALIIEIEAIAMAHGIDIQGKIRVFGKDIVGRMIMDKNLAPGEDPLILEGPATIVEVQEWIQGGVRASEQQ